MKAKIACSILTKLVISPANNKAANKIEFFSHCFGLANLIRETIILKNIIVKDISQLQFPHYFSSNLPLIRYHYSMKENRERRKQPAHYCLMVNKQATNYTEKLVSELISLIRSRNYNYTVVDSSSPSEMISRTEKLCGGDLRRALPDYIRRRGKVTALVACGGDGTFNIAGRTAMNNSLPVGIYPLGRDNNIFHSLFENLSISKAGEQIFSKDKIVLRTGLVGNQPFFGSLGFGLTIELMKYLRENKRPRFGFGWSKVASKTISAVKPKSIVIKIDSFKFETDIKFLNINLLKYSAGIPIGNGSLGSDNKLEVFFDFAASDKHFRNFLKGIVSGNYVYGSEIRMFRGEKIILQPMKNEVIYVDGELIEIPSNIVEVSLSDSKLKVLGKK